MRLIDADKFANDEYLEKRYGTDFYWEFRKRLDKQPTVDVLDKIRDEIENLNCEYIDYDTGCSAYISQNEVLQILNKYIKE